jgi:autophagy-related protein 18
MNLSGKYNSSLLFANFNQDYSGISVGTPDGFRIFSCDPFVNIFTQSDGGIGIAEMLFMTSLVAVVGAGDQPTRSPRRLQIINTKSRSIICEQNFVTAILSVKLNKKRMAVVMETKIHIYDISTMKILHTIDTFPNPKGVCAFSPCHKKSYLAYPASQSTGDVYLFDTLSLQTVSSVTAHKASIAAMAISQDGLLLATASEKGTVIRVHGLPNMAKCESFRRGTYPAGITSLCFSLDSRYLAAASDTGTVHIYRVSFQGPASTRGGLFLWNIFSNDEYSNDC